MDWTLAKEMNRDALLRVLVMLLAMIGLIRGGSVAVLPRRVRLKVLRLLRVAESALRRLLFAEARRMAVDLPPSRSASTGNTKKDRRGAAKSALSFRLIEPLQRTGPPARRYGKGPIISFFDGSDPVREEPPAPPSPHDEVDAEALCRRMNALGAVLDDLSKYARRLALWQARRAAAASRPGRRSPLRPGRPPGYRARGVHPVYEILKECDRLARFPWPPDTS